VRIPCHVFLALILVVLFARHGLYGILAGKGKRYG